jgi:hypothetical protein
MDRRSFFKRTAGTVAAAAILPWVEVAPKAEPSVALGTHVWRPHGETAYGYRQVQATEELHVGDVVYYDQQFNAKRITSTDSGCIGIATADVRKGDLTWLMIHGQHDVAMVSYPYVIAGETHSLKTG